eukprot:s1424_g7.t1
MSQAEKAEKLLKEAELAQLHTQTDVSIRIFFPKHFHPVAFRDPGLYRTLPDSAMTALESSARRSRRTQRAPETVPGLPALSYTSMKKCSRGDQCTFAHDESQLRGKPDLAGTKLCRFYAAGQPCTVEMSCFMLGSNLVQRISEWIPSNPHKLQDFPIIDAPTERAQLLAALELLQTWVNQNGNNDQGTSEKMPMRRLSDGPSRKDESPSVTCCWGVGHCLQRQPLPALDQSKNPDPEQAQRRWGACWKILLLKNRTTSDRSLFRHAIDIHWFRGSFVLYVCNVSTPALRRKKSRDASAAAEIFRSLGDHAKTAEAMRILIAGKLRKADGARPVEALEHVNQELARFRELGSRIGEASMMLSLAEINTDRRGTRKREESLQMGLEALEIFKELGNKRLQVSALQHLSNVHIKFCDKGCAGKSGREATRYAQEALALARTLQGDPVQDKLYEASALHNVAVGKWYSECPFKDGLKAAKEALQIFRQLGLKKFQAAQLHSIADWHQRRGIGKQGLPFAEESLQIFQEIESGKGWESAALCTVVSALMDKDDTEAAVKVAQEGVEKFRQKGDKQAEAQALDLLAGVYLASNEKDEALKLAEESLALFREVGDKRAESYVLHTVSQVQAKSENHEEAVKLVKESLVLAGELGDTREQAKCLAQLCRMHLLAREYKEAIDFAEEAQVVFQKSQDKCGEGVTLLNKASAHMGMGEIDVALQVAEDANAMFIQEEDKRQEATAHHFLYEIHTQAGNYEAALREAIMARTMFHKLGDQREEASMCLRVSCAHIQVLNNSRNLGRRETKKGCDGALKAAKEAVAIAKKFEREKAFLANAYSMMGQCQGMVGKMKARLLGN